MGNTPSIDDILQRHRGLMARTSAIQNNTEQAQAWLAEASQLAQNASQMAQKTNHPNQKLLAAIAQFSQLLEEILETKEEP
jgi:hypothetical protein